MCATRSLSEKAIKIFTFLFKKSSRHANESIACECSAFNDPLLKIKSGSVKGHCLPTPE